MNEHLLILKNQVIIMRALLLHMSNDDVAKQLSDQILFTEALIKNLS